MGKQLALPETAGPVVPAPLATVQAAQRALRRITEALAPATRAAYAADWDDWARFCAAHDLDALPPDLGAVVTWLEQRAARHAPSTVLRALSALSSLSQAAGHEALFGQPAVRQWLRAYLRDAGGVAPRSQAPALDRAAMLAVLAPLVDLDAVTAQRGLPALAARQLAVRDRALLLVGWLGALRSSELSALQCEDVTETAEGLRLCIRRSKTDQEGKGHVRGLARGSAPLVCPVTAWKAWLQLRAEIGLAAEGVAFVSLRTGRPGGALNRQRVSEVVKRRAAAVGLQASGHSLRAGFATQAARAGVADRDIARHGGWRSRTTVDRYIREGKLFDQNPTAGLL